MAHFIDCELGLTLGKFVAIFFLFSCSQVAQCHYYVENTACGVLYSDGNFSGQEFPLNDRGQSVNLREDLHASDGGGWNVTGSWIIENSCSMEICNETYFDGMCQHFGGGNYQDMTNLSMSSIESVSCSCAKECKCSDIFMKKSSCARAYFKGGCRTCHTSYADFDGAKSYVPEDFVGKIEALRLRKGCTLTAYKEEDFEGEEEIIDSEIIEDYNGIIRSYECDCNDAEFEPRVRPPRPSRPGAYSAQTNYVLKVPNLV